MYITQTKKEITFDSGSKTPNVIKWSDDSKYLAIGNTKGSILIWDHLSQKKILVSFVHKAPIIEFIWISNKELVTGSTDATVSLFHSFFLFSLLLLLLKNTILVQMKIL